jgi:hypothetical protein
MRKRYQKGSLTKEAGKWVLQWYESGSRRKLRLGKVSEISKSQAQAKLAEILAPINAGQEIFSEATKFKDFVKLTVFPFYRKRWKASTRSTTEYRIQLHLIDELGATQLGQIMRDDLQAFART